MSIQSEGRDSLSEIFYATNSSIASLDKAYIYDDDVESDYMSVKTSYSEEGTFNKTLLQLCDSEFDPTSMNCCPTYIDDIFVYEIYREVKVRFLIYSGENLLKVT